MTNNLGIGSALKVGGVSSKYATNYLIGYSGISDANSFISGLTKLTYNGVESSTNNIANGSYTYWTYEHLYVHPDASELAKSVAESIGTACKEASTAEVNPNVGYNDMRVGRNGDGLYIYAN
jgi:ABC-type phosphate transport system substrate-binding protein